ncbi:PREDICTED: uncharacterized protein LOC109591920 [Amphimedon queenslandica]|nr:PREDICTED: uncharacterized protein LOC109591920 [Amphimedon queenslandica]|eukprot:XP_019863081.1 PREDICTED: uncharacterized protein LOC109591920 [Amphimedon queenslandica]
MVMMSFFDAYYCRSGQIMAELPTEEQDEAEFKIGQTDEGPENDEENDYYPMEAVPQGLCLLIDIAHFERHKGRLGSDNDAAKLQDLFENVLNFRVAVLRDPTLQELHHKLIQTYQLDHSAYDAFFVIILSHGDQGDQIYTSDSRLIKIGEISDYFTASMCPSLANKPKCFIIQACRGFQHNRPITVSSSPRSSITESHFDVTQTSHDMSHDGGGLLSNFESCQIVPDKKDFYYAFATIEDHEALRHCEEGSWFISEFVKAVKYFARKYTIVDLQEVMLKVTGKVSKYSHEGRMQVCQTKGSITRKILLSVNEANLPTPSSSSFHSLTSSELNLDVAVKLRENKLNKSRPSSAGELVIATTGSSPALNRHSYHSPYMRRQSSPPLPFLRVPSVLGLRRQYSATPPHPLSRSSLASSIASETSLPLTELSSISKPGYCIVLNSGKSDDKKMAAIRKVFSDQLQFHVQVYNFITPKGIKHLLRTVAKIDHCDLNCLVVIVPGPTIPSNLQLHKILSPFAAHRSTIPKLFFIETKLNNDDRDYFYNAFSPVEVPLSYIYTANAVEDIKNTFLECLLQVITATTDRIVFQDVMRSTQKIFKNRESSTSCRITSIDKLEDQLILRPAKSQTEGEGKDVMGNKHKYSELLLAVRLLEPLRNTTINKLQRKKINILRICRQKIPRGKAESKALSDDNLEGTQATLEVDKQLTQQVNSLIGGCSSIARMGSLLLPIELSELISNCTKWYKTSEDKMVTEFDRNLDSLKDQCLIMKEIVRFITERGMEEQ